MKKVLLIEALCIVLLGVILTGSAEASEFDLSIHSVPIDEIMSGGPAKDAIPALSDPVFVSASEAEFLEDSDIVLGVEIEGKAKAYPIKILNWHEAVNDELSGTKILATW